MFRAIAAALAGFLVLAAQPVLAIEWFTDTDGGATTTAAFDGANSVAVSCAAGTLTFAVRVRQSDVAPPIAAADPIYVLTTSDPAADGSTPSFTSRATPADAGSLRAFTLSSKDSAARIAAFTAARTEIEFSLLTEPGGERFNTFRLPVAGASEALGEVLAACSGPATAAQPGGQSAAATDTAQSSDDSGAIGPGPANDSFWHMNERDESGRVYGYWRDKRDSSLTFACAAGELSLTVGVSIRRLISELSKDTSANLVIVDAAGVRDETVPRIDRDGTAFYILRGDKALYYLSLLASGSGMMTIGLGAPDPSGYTYEGDVRHGLAFPSRTLQKGILDVIAACGMTNSHEAAAEAPKQKPQVAETTPPVTIEAPATIEAPEAAIEPEPQKEEPPPVASAQTDWTLDGWTSDDSEDVMSADAAVMTGGMRLSVGFSCTEMLYGLAVRLPNSVLDPAVADRGEVHLGLNFGGSYHSFATKRLDLEARTWFYLDPADARAALYYAQNAPGDQLVFELIDDDSGARVNHITTNRRGLDAALGDVERACQADLPEEPAPAERPQDVWNYYVDAAGRPTAEVEHDGAVLSFFCSEGLVFFFSLPSVHEQIASRKAIDVLLSIDPVDGTATRHWVSGLEFAPDETGAALGFRGPAVDDWAHLAQGANRVIEVGLSTNAGGDEFQMYNTTEFPAKGSTAAIKQLRQACN